MNPNWHISDIDILEKKLNTSADRGLSRMAARKRLSKEKKRDSARQGSLFVGTKRPAIQCFLGTRALSQLLLILSSLTFFLLGDIWQGIVIISILVIGMLAFGIMYLAAQRSTEASMLYSNPTQKVIREGKTGLTDCRNIVVGDVIEFSAKDYIAGDARIIYSENLEVEEVFFEDGEILFRRVKKDFISDGRECVDPCESNTTLKAGSFVLSGYGRAIVVGTGSNTYASRQLKNGSFAAKNSDIEEVKYIGKFFSKIKPVVCFAPVILALAGIFTLNVHVSAVLMMALCAAEIVEFISVPAIGRIISSSVLLKFAHPKNGADAVIIKNNSAVDALRNLTDIIFVGRAGLTDGKKHVVSLIPLGNELEDEYSTGEIQGIYKYLYLYQKAVKEQAGEFSDFSKEGFCDGIESYLVKSGFDYEEARLMLHSLYLVRDGDEYFACAEYGQDIFRVSLSDDIRMLDECESIRVRGGIEDINESYLDIARMKSNDARASGKQFYFIISEYDGKRILEGIVFFSEWMDDNLSERMVWLKNIGINITIMLAGEDEIDARCVSALQSYNENDFFVARASEYKKQGKDILDGHSNCHVYMGFEPCDYERLLLKLKSEERRIAVFGIDDRYDRMWKDADVYFGCDPINYSSKKYSESVLDVRGQDGIETSDRISQLSRTKAEVIVRRTSSTGGGIQGVINAVNAAECIVRSNRYALRTIMLSVIAPLCFVILSFLSGIMFMSYASVLLVGTLFVILTVAVFSLISTEMAGKQTKTIAVEKFFYDSRYMILPPVIASVVFAAAFIVFKVSGFSETTNGISLASLLSVVIVQICEIIFSIRACTAEGDAVWEKRPDSRYSSYMGKSYITAVIMCVLLLLGSLIFGIIPVGSSIFDFVGETFKMLLLCPLYIVSYFVTKFIINKKSSSVN